MSANRPITASYLPPVKIPWKCRMGWHDWIPIIREAKSHGIPFGWVQTGSKCNRCRRVKRPIEMRDDGNFD